MAKRTVTPFTILTKVRSESGSWEYEIRVSHKTGVTYCTCTGWQFHKRCKHLDAYNAQPEFSPGRVATAPSADLGAAVRPLRPVKTAQPTTPAGVLLAQLSRLGIASVTAQDAKRIADAVLATVGAKATDARIDDGEINTANVRVIVLPD